MRNCRALVAVGLTAVTLVCSNGCCWLGPRAIESERIRYNEAVRETWNEQFLLNLVRLRYTDPPEFDVITNITAQHEYTGNWNESELFKSQSVPNNVFNPNLFAQSAFGFGGNVSNRPSISYSPLEGADFAKHLLGPIHIETIVGLTQSGWDIDRVLRLTVHGLNDLEYAPQCAGQPEVVPPWDSYMAVVSQLRELQKRRVLELAYDDITIPRSGPVEVESLKLNDAVGLAEKNFELRQLVIKGSGSEPPAKGSKPGETMQLVSKAHVPVMRLDSEAWHQDGCSPEFLNALRLLPGQDYYRLVLGADIGRIRRPGADCQDLIVSPRSVLGVMLFAAHGVEIPPKHLEKGLVNFPVDESGEPFDPTALTCDLIRVHCSKVRPCHAFVKVHYRDHWFYIDDNDLQSKQSFALIIEVFLMEVSGGVVPGPILTLPVSGGSPTIVPTGGGAIGGRAAAMGSPAVPIP